MAASSPNPFGEVNPYAAPAIPDPIEPYELAGIGVWRHGTLLVVHAAAYLPPVCIKSAEPADVRRTVQLRWSHWARWPREYLRVQIGLSDRWEFWLTTGQRLVLLGAIALAALTIGIAFVLLPGDEVEPLVVLLAASVTLSAFLWWTTLVQPLRIVRRKRQYYWLSGAHRVYLGQFPEWPYGA